MPEMVIYRGLPASGKTTMARARQKLSGGALVGRDHLRWLLFGTDRGLSHEQENRITEAQEELIRSTLRDGRDVLVDDMNLKMAYVRRLARIGVSEGADIVYEDMTDVPVETCVTRDYLRQNSIGAPVIEDQYQRYIKGSDYPLLVPVLQNEEIPVTPELYVPDTSKPRAVIVDVDGTVALHTSGRSPYDMSRVKEDEPNRPVLDLVSDIHRDGDHIIFVSARTDDAWYDTVAWLWDHSDLGRFRLFMRRVGDYRKDAIVKQEIFDELIRDQFNVRFVIDDRNQVVRMWRSLGLTCLQVADGDF